MVNFYALVSPPGKWVPSGLLGRLENTHKALSTGQCLTHSERSVQSVVVCHRNVPSPSYSLSTLAASKPKSLRPIKVRRLLSPSTAEARPQPGLPGRAQSGPRPRHERAPISQGHPQNLGEGARGAQTAPATWQESRRLRRRGRPRTCPGAPGRSSLPQPAPAPAARTRSSAGFRG